LNDVSTVLFALCSIANLLRKILTHSKLQYFPTEQNLFTSQTVLVRIYATRKRKIENYVISNYCT